MIRLIQNNLIIPRGDTGTFSVPVPFSLEESVVGVFTILDLKSNTKILEKQVTPNEETLTIEFLHGDTVNLPIGKYAWDIKFYLNPIFADGKLIDGTQINSYYAAYKLPYCEIRQTGDNLLTSDESPDTIIEPQSLNALETIANEIVNAKEVAMRAAVRAREDANHIVEYIDDAAQNASAAADSATEANEYANSANISSSKARGYAANASDSADAAAQSAIEARGYADSTTIEASAANNSAISASNFAIAAATSESNASNSADAAAASALAAQGYAEQLTDLTAIATTLSPTQNATADYDNETGILTIGVPQGNGIQSIVMNADYTLTINFTNNTSITTNAIRGATGVGIQSIAKTATSENIDTYTITYTDNNTSTFTVINGITPLLSIGTVIEGPEAQASITGTSSNPVLNLTLPSANIELKADKLNTVIENSLSMGRKANTTVGTNSLAFGYNTIASGHGSIAFGFEAEATGASSIAIGNNSEASGTKSLAIYDGEASGYQSIAIGSNTTSSGTSSVAIGGTVQAVGSYSTVLGVNNVVENTFPVWQKNTHYNVGDCVIINTNTGALGYRCTTENTGQALNPPYWEIISNTSKQIITVGNGNITNPNNKSNAFALDWDGTGHFAGDIYVGANSNSTGGNKVATVSQVNNKLDSSLKGAAYGLAELDSNGHVPSSQLPSYVDDVLEFNNTSGFPQTGEAGKIYVAKDLNLTFRWSGSTYVEISPSLALGETSSTAYRGDRGKIAYAHAQAKGNEYAEGLYKITTNAHGHVTSATAVQKADITSLGIPAQDTTYENKIAANGGLDISLVTTGEKYNWNNKYDKPINGIPASDLAEGTIPDTTIYATKTDTVLTSTLSRGRASGSTIGQVSFAFGEDVTASGIRSHAEGNSTHAIGNDSHAEGYSSAAEGSYTHAEGVSTLAKGNASHAEGLNTVANGSNAHAEGVYTIANGNASHAGGWFNVADTYDSWNEWAANTEYNIGDKVKITNENTVKGYICTTANSDASFTSSKWSLDSQMNYIESIGNGTTNNARSNARTLDWEGNEWLKGDLYVGANANGTGGSKVAKVSEIPDITGKADKVISATSGNFAALDSNGNLTDSGHKHLDYLTEHQSLTGKQDKITASGILKGDGSGGVTAAVAGTDYIASHQDISGKADKVSGGTNGNFAALDSNGNLVDSGHKHSDYLTEHQTIPVTDVQINSTSILNNGVATIPAATASSLGVVMTDFDYGTNINSNGRISVVTSYSSQVKAGTQAYRPVTPLHQHEAAFYGLSKAAGVDLANETVTLGTYPATSKAAIQTMLGVENGVSFVETVVGTTPTITGMPNTRYKCGEISTISITPPAVGTIDVTFTSGSSVAILTIPNTVKFPAWFDPTILETNTTYEIIITDGIYGSVMLWSL